jgi:hypothetical protein
MMSDRTSAPEGVDLIVSKTDHTGALLRAAMTQCHRALAAGRGQS